MAIQSGTHALSRSVFKVRWLWDKNVILLSGCKDGSCQRMFGISFRRGGSLENFSFFEAVCWFDRNDTRLS
jgi:hypothetical protein